MAAEKKQAGAEGQQGQPEFGIQRIYVKDLSLEAPKSPKIFLAEWKPELNMDIHTKADVLDQDVHEVVLTITVTVKIKDDIAFVVEVKQAGIFSIKDFPEEQVKPMLGSFCPNILYPYAREVITDVVVKAGFPQLYLAPVNFDALYNQQEEADKAKKGGKK